MSGDGAHVYVANFGASTEKFSEAGTPEGTVDSANTQSVAVDPSTEDVYVVDEGGARIQPYDSAGAPLTSFAAGLSGFTAGLGVNAATHFLYASNLERGGAIFGLGEPPEAPVTGAASEVSGTTALLHGELNPGGKAGELKYDFVYTKATGTCAAPIEGGATPTETVVEAKNAAVKAEATGLTPRTKYKFCLVSISPWGSAFGAAGEFETPAVPPSVLSENSSNVKASEARLEGVVNPNNQVTECHFQYGETTVTEHEVPCEPASLEGFGGQAVGVTATGLHHKAIYHWRIVAKNGTGETTGKEEELKTTLPPERPEKEEAKEITGSTVTLAGVLNANSEGEAGTYEFLYKASAAECEAGVATPRTPSTGHAPEPVSAAVTGLVPNTQYTFCLLARNAVEEAAIGPPVTFTTAKVAPTVGGQSFSNVGSASVDLSTKVDDYGVPGTYRYEYGTTASYGSSTPTVSLGSVNGEVAAPATLDGLQPDTVYHFRVLVSSEAGTTPGNDMAFSTLNTGSLSLPDGRVYEDVSPVNNDNAEVYVPKSLTGFLTTNIPGLAGNPSRKPFRAAAGGDAVTYVGDPTTGGNGQEAFSGNQYLATRSPLGGWTQVNVQPAVKLTPEYVGFSSDLSVGVVKSEEPLAAGIPEKVEYAYSTNPGSESFRALGEILRGTQDSSGNGYTGGNAGTSAVPAFSHVLLRDSAGLADATGGRRVAVNILPNGETAPNAVFGAPQVFNTREDGPVLDHVISADGSRIVWTDRSTGALYVRENDTAPPSPVAAGKCTVAADACTVLLDAGSSGGALFWTASGDGSKIFFTDCSRITADATAVFTPGCGAEPFGKLSGSDLYAYDPNSGELTDLTVDHNASDPHGANVQGVVGESQDGSYVYFVATGSLAPGASAGEPNLYLARAGVVTFVTTLSFADERYESTSGFGGGVGPWEQSLTDRTAQVAPDGRSLVFEAAGEVYHYELEHGRPVVCVSCSPSVEVSSLSDAVTVGAKGGFLPVTEDESTDTYQQRWISEDGSRVFFESSQALVPQDVNGVQDVYEWERDGSGSCHTSPGCLYLLSGGTSTSWSTLLDASPSGNDVFVITRARLTPEDENDYFHVFDARVGGVSGVAATACSGSGCQGVPPAPPVFATPSSATFSGAGNFPPSVPPVPTKKKATKKTIKCAKGKKPSHGKCVKSKKKAKKAKRAGNNRRAGR